MLLVLDVMKYYIVMVVICSHPLILPDFVPPIEDHHLEEVGVAEEIRIGTEVVIDPIEMVEEIPTEIQVVLVVQVLLLVLLEVIQVEEVETLDRLIIILG